MFNESDSCNDPRVVDLLSFLHDPSINLFYSDVLGKLHPPSARYIFPARYNGLKGQISLTNDLCYAANKSGFRLTACRHRSDPNGKHIVFACPNHRSYEPRISADKAFGKDELYASNIKPQCARRNRAIENRGRNGVFMPKKNNQSRPTDPARCCPFFITIHLFYPTQQWYLTKGWSGRGHHFHPSFDPELIRPKVSRLNSSELKLCEDMSKIHSKSHMVSKLIQVRTGDLLSSQQIEYLRQKQDSLQQLADSITDRSQSSAEKLLDTLKSTEDVSFIALFHEPESTLLAPRNPGFQINELKKRKEKETKSHFWSTMKRIHSDSVVTERLPESVANRALREESVPDAEGRRKALTISDGQRMLLAIIWITDEDKRLFSLYPEVLFADTTFGTNNEKRPLFKIAACDANNQNFTVVNGYLPSQRSWVFHFVQVYAVPLLTGPMLLKINLHYISDDDSDMYDPVVHDSANEGAWKGTKQSLCMWHLVYKKFEKSIKEPSNLTPSQLKICTQHILLAKYWVCTWFRECETHEEINLSKRMLEYWLELPEIEEAMGPGTGAAIKDLIDTRIMAHYSKWNRADRLYLRSFDQTTSNAVEHENYSVKVEGSVVHASMNINTAASVMNAKTTFRNRIKSQNAAAAITEIPTWSKTPTAEHITKYAEGLLMSQWRSRVSKVSARVEKMKWYVASKTRRTPFKDDDPSTTFTRVRTVSSVLHNGEYYLICSCGYHQRQGIPCRHLLHVTDCIKLEYIDPRWHKVFRHYYGKHEVFTRSYVHSQFNPVPGILCPSELLVCSGSYPLLNGVEDVSFFTSILESPCPVVRNYCEKLQPNDFSVWDDGTQMLLTHNSTHLPSGAGTTLCLSQNAVQELGSGTLIAPRGCDYDSDTQEHFVCNVLEDKEACLSSADDTSNVGCKDLSNDLKLMYYEIVDIVDGDPQLQRAALIELSCVHKKIMTLYNDKATCEERPDVAVNKQAKIVSSNVRSETQTIRKRQRGRYG